MTSFSQAHATRQSRSPNAPSAINARASLAALRQARGDSFAAPAGASRHLSDQGADVITDKIVKGAGSHRILMSLRERPRTSKELKRLVGAINSISRFDGEYMERLEANGYVFMDGETWTITIKGLQKCQSLGDPEKQGRAQPRTMVFQATVMSRPPAPRPGSMDFENWPSRRGDYLYFRDGRIERIK